MSFRNNGCNGVAILENPGRSSRPAPGACLWLQGEITPVEGLTARGCSRILLAGLNRSEKMWRTSMTLSEPFDAVVVGGGIIGCATAWRLAQTGRRVALLERGRVGAEASSAAGGILIPANAPDLPLPLLQFWKTSNALYPACVAETRELTGHAFEFRVLGRLVVGFEEEDTESLRQTFAI